jgi:outer membrane biosynthesis protein TonB
MLPYVRALSLVVLLATFASGCRKRHVAVPVAPLPAPAAPADTTAPATTPTLPAQAPPAATATQPQNPPSPEDANQKNRPPQPQTPQPQPSSPPQAPQNPPPRRPNGPGQPNPAPRLGDILTPQQERQYNTAIDQSLAHAQSSLGSIASRQLTKEQQGVVTQIQGFIQQAQSTRKSNLPAARSLAERAEVLARDLAGSLR